MKMPLRTNWLLAVQWDYDSLQYILVKRASKNEITLVSARSLEHTNESDYIAELLKSEMEKHGVRKPDVLVTLPRSMADLIPMELPPSTDEELANLVPLQAMQYVDLGNESMLDYLPLDSHSTTEEVNRPAEEVGEGPDQNRISRRVLAIHPQRVAIESIRDTLQAADLSRIVRIAFRPLSSLALVRRLLSMSDKPSAQDCKKRSLFITLQDQHADLLLMAGQRLVQNRSIRLPQRADPMFTETVVAEINRTALVAPTAYEPRNNDVADEESSISQILAFGGTDEQEHWRAIEQLVEVPVQLINPLECLSPSSPVAVRQSGHFAPLVGVLLEHTSNRTSDVTINFLAPRRPVTPPSILRRFGIYALAAAALLTMGGYLLYDQRATAETQILQLEDQLRQEERIGDKLQRRQRIALAVKQWQSDDVNCLDELLDLSERFPGPRDAYIQRLAIAPARGGKSLVLQVRARDQQLVKEFESRLRDAYHHVVTKPVSESASDEDFPWQFDATILVAPRPKENYRTSLKQSNPKATSTSQTEEPTTTKHNKTSS